jgi:hypothetical protein
VPVYDEAGEDDFLQVGVVVEVHAFVVETEQGPESVLGQLQGWNGSGYGSSSSSMSSAFSPAQYGVPNASGLRTFSMIPESGDRLKARRSLPSPVQMA